MTEFKGYGPGTFVDDHFTTVPQECRRVLENMAAQTPGFTVDPVLLNGVCFEGDALPCIPGPIKSQVVTSVLHAMAGVIGHEILHLRGIQTNNVTRIDTIHGGMYNATPALVTVDGLKGPELSELKTLPNWDHGRTKTPLLKRTFAIYKTKTPHVWFQFHGSSNPWALLRSFGLDPEMELAGDDDAYEQIQAVLSKFHAAEIEQRMLDQGFVGQTVHSPKGWLETTMGKSISRHPLINYKMQTQSSPVLPAPFPVSNDKRPLAGIRVLEIARIIAAPAAGAALASMGAEVIRVNTDKLMDYTKSQICSLMAGKITLNLDLNDPTDHERLMTLFEQADVIIQGYRLGSLGRRGFSLNHALEMAAKRGKGVVYLDENCYGLDGYYAERPGWQQVADAAAGSEYVMGQAFGKPPGQGVLPSLPISDMSTGIMSCVTIMSALRDRAKFGGSYHGNAALVAFNMATLSEDIRLYQPEIVQKIQEKHDFPTWSSDAYVTPLYYAVAEAWEKTSTMIEDEKYYVHFQNGPYGKDHRVLAPVVRYDDPETTPRWLSPPVPFCYHSYRLFS